MLRDSRSSIIDLGGNCTGVMVTYAASTLLGLAQGVRLRKGDWLKLYEHLTPPEGAKVSYRHLGTQAQMGESLTAIPSGGSQAKSREASATGRHGLGSHMSGYNNETRKANMNYL